MDWIRVTGRWQLSGKTPQPEKNIATGKHKSADERDVSQRAADEEERRQRGSEEADRAVRGSTVCTASDGMNRSQFNSDAGSREVTS